MPSAGHTAWLPWAARTWTGRSPSAPTPRGRVRPPPVPGALTERFAFSTQRPFSAWAAGRRAWAGPRVPPDYPGGGVLIAPDPQRQVMRVFAWWPDARLVDVARYDPDRRRRRVRGAAPVRVDEPTRRNYVLNPSGEAGLNGVESGQGNPVLSNPPRLDEVGGRAIAGRVTGAGPCQVGLPVARMPANPRVATVALDAQLDARATGLTAQVQWETADGSALDPSTVTFAPVASLERYSRHVATVTAPVGAATAANLEVTATMPAGGGTLAIDQVVLEPGITDGSPASGASPGGQWLGTPELSMSVIAPIVEIPDGECPFGVPVSYEVLVGGARGGRVRSQRADLPCRGRWPSVTHPRFPHHPVRVWIVGMPEISNELASSKLKVMGRRNVVTVTGPERDGDAGTLEFITHGPAEYEALFGRDGLFADGAPLLVRMPPEVFDVPPLWWLSFGASSRAAPNHFGGHQRRNTTVPFDEVDPPLVVTLTGNR